MLESLAMDHMSLPTTGEAVTQLKAAELLGVSRFTVSDWLRRGKLRGKYDEATRTWSIAIDEIHRVIRDRSARREGPSVAEIVTEIDRLYIDAVALVATACAQFLDAHRALEAQARRYPDSHPAQLIESFQKALDLLVAVVRRYEQLATTRATVHTIEARGPALPHPEDRSQESV
jgi:predicted transcriptional regulator